MPVAGRKPKPDGQKRHRVKPAFDWVEVLNVPYRGSHPKADPAWPADTQRWWRATSSMPHCVLWSETDWEFAWDTAQLHVGLLTHASELRLRAKVLGLTVDARRDLRIRYVDEVASVSSGGVTAIDEYRSMVADG